MLVTDRRHNDLPICEAVSKARSASEDFTLPRRERPRLAYGWGFADVSRIRRPMAIARGLQGSSSVSRIVAGRDARMAMAPD